MSKVKQLREERFAIATKMGEILKQEQTAETRAEWAKLDAAQEVLRQDIERIERSDKLAAEMADAAPARNAAVGNDTRKEDAEKEYREIFKNYLHSGVSGLKPEARQKLMEKRVQEAGTQSLTYTQGTAGGYFVPAGYVYDVDVATKYFAPLMDGSVVRILETATGNLLPYPTTNDTTQSASVIGEAGNTDTADQDLTLGVVNFGAWKYRSGVVKVSLELLQDSAFDLESFLKEQFAIRFGRGYERDFTVGSGINKPTGIVTAVLASGVSPVIATGSSTNDGSGATGANSIGTNDYVALEHSVDPSYRRGASFMFHDNTLKAAKQLLDKYGRPIWLPGLAANAPDTVLGYKYTINQSMDNSVSATKNTVLFGAMQKFIIRKVKDMSIIRLDERYADFGLVAFLAFSRVDSNLIDAGTHPVNILQQHS